MKVFFKAHLIVTENLYTNDQLLDQIFKKLGLVLKIDLISKLAS